MRLRTVLLCLACALLVALPALAQIPTATLRGQVTNENKGLPGVTVSVTSPNLQGTRTTTTTSSGDYIVPLLPPGPYQVSFELQGFQTVQRSVTLAAQQTTPLDVSLSVEKISEEIVVTGTAETISVTPQASTTYEKKFVEQLPVERNIRETVLLTPGVVASGPGGNARARGISIAGSQSYENLFMVNGVVINENLRGQPFDLFIEDAIQETTTTTSAVSAEYGRFGGGVVNTITKSGGNDVHASFRDNVTNDKWTDVTPLNNPRTNKVNNRYEATLGGYLLKDRLWYFGAGRNFKESLTGNTVAATALTYPIVNDEKRYEGKLTLSPLQGQRIIGSYIKITRSEAGNVFGNIMDLASVVNRSLPQDLKAFNYNGVFTDKFFVEGQYSERNFTFVHSGSVFTDRINGTLMVDRPTGFRYNSPTFCGVCTPEDRNNKNTVIKGSYFLSNDAVGAHDMVFGYDTYNDIRKANNHQSGSDFRILVRNTLVAGQTPVPQVYGTDSTFIQWNPILVSSLGTAFKTNSLFFNDKWRLNDHASFNLGVRYDKNDGKDSQGQKVAKDSRVSPRLAAAYDFKGDGDWVMSANYSQYVTAIANTQADATSQGGNPAAIQWFYRGPDINAPGTAFVPTSEVIKRIFDWFDSQGGTANTANLRLVNIPGGTTVIRGSLDSPYTQEVSVGLTKRLGTRGLLRADVVRRDSKAFYSTRVDLSTGQVLTATGTPADLAVIENSDQLQRQYTGLHTQFQYRFTDRFTLGGFWTLAELKGNVDGENAGSGPISSGQFQYPEYADNDAWSNPKGDLLADVRNRVRLWGVWDIFKTSHNSLNFTILQTFSSGQPYGAVGGIDTRFRAEAYTGDPRACTTCIKNPGYAIPPTAVQYYYTKRDAFRTSNISSTDLSLNYSFNINGPFNKSYEIFFEPEILNVFNQHGLLNVNATVLDSTNTPFTCPASNPTCHPGDPGATGFVRFNPFTTKPVEGPSGSGANFQRGPKFGQANIANDYQLPRTFRFSVGIRF